MAGAVLDDPQAFDRQLAGVALGGLATLVIAEIGTRARRAHRRSRAARDEVDRVYRVAELAAHGAPPDEVVSSVCAELIALFDLDDCTYEAFPDATAAELPRLGERGAL